MKIRDDIHLIDGTMANCYFIENEGSGILIDTGTKGSGKKILKFLGDHSYRLSTVLITHYHMDHIGGLHQIVDSLGPEVYVPDVEADVVRGKKKPAATGSFMSKMVGMMAHPEPVADVKPVSSFKSEVIDVLETNGHTPGSTSYIVKGKGILFAGDAVVNGKNGLSINRTFTLDIGEAENSEKKILASGAEVILSGHGNPYYTSRHP